MVSGGDLQVTDFNTNKHSWFVLNDVTHNKLHNDTVIYDSLDSLKSNTEGAYC